MKITPVITSILINAFAVVGFISFCFILIFKMLNGDPQPKLSCLNDSVFDFVSSYSVNGEKYELVRYTSSLSDKNNILVVYKRADRKKGCIDKDKQLAMEIMEFNHEERLNKRYPAKITISKNKINVSYSDSEDFGNINNVPVVWDIKSKLAAANVR